MLWALAIVQAAGCEAACACPRAQVLASVPDLDMVSYLPLFLDSLLDCLCDPFGEVRAQATKVLQVGGRPAPKPLASSWHDQVAP